MRARSLLIRIADILETMNDFEGSDMAESLSLRDSIKIQIPEDIAKALLAHPDRAIAVVLPMIESALDKREEDSESSF